MKLRAVIIPLLAVVLSGGLAVALPAATRAGAAVPRPRIISISPPAGLPAGGGPLTIDGTGLGGVTKVKFGASTTTKFTFRSATRLRVRTPAHHAATVAVHVFSPGGRSATTSAARYVYTSPPRPLNWSGAAPLYSSSRALVDVSCRGTNFCVAIDDVGAYTYDGSSWSPPTRLIGEQDGTPEEPQLSHVSCASPGFCLAVGSSGAGLLIYRWDGTSWGSAVRINTSDVPPHVSCAPDTTMCAVSGFDDLYVDRDGTWTAVPAGDDVHPGLVACATSDFCLVNDDHVYDGTAVRPLGADDPLYFATQTSCASPTFCVAIDEGGSTSVFDGSAWSAPSTRLAHFRTASLSCPSTTFCYAFSGGAFSRSAAISDGIVFDGTSWSDSEPVDADAGVIAGSCGAPGDCVAVDDAMQSVRRVGGTWQAPVQIAPDRTALTDVSCAATTMCMAVDRSGNAVRFDGNGWSDPQRIDGHHFLADISCPTASFCVAIDVSTWGFQMFRHGGYAVVWRGPARGWSDPTRVDAATQLTSLSCGSDKLCFASDNFGQVFRFDGQNWSSPTRLAPGRNRPHGPAGLVSCASASFCLAMFNPFDNGPAAGREYIWRGHDWASTRRYPELLSTTGPLSCPSAQFCAIGGQAGIIMRHDTTTGYGGGHDPYARPVSLSCARQSFCLMTTRFGDEDRPDYHPSLTFDGSAYGPARMPLTGGTVSCAPSETCAVVRGTSAAVGTR